MNARAFRFTEEQESVICLQLRTLFGKIENTNKLLEAAMCSYKPLYGVVTVTNARSWDVTPCRLVKIYRCLVGKYCVRIQCRRVTGLEGSEEGCSRFLQTLVSWYKIT